MRIRKLREKKERNIYLFFTHDIFDIFDSSDTIILKVYLNGLFRVHESCIPVDHVVWVQYLFS